MSDIYIMYKHFVNILNKYYLTLVRYIYQCLSKLSLINPSQLKRTVLWKYYWYIYLYYLVCLKSCWILLGKVQLRLSKYRRYTFYTHTQILNSWLFLVDEIPK